MHQTDKFTAIADKLLKTLEEATDSIGEEVGNLTNNMSEKDALEFTKEYDKHNVDSELEKLRQQAKEVLPNFNL